jgi:tetratricopeptide (TPR) repeat protein
MLARLQSRLKLLTGGARDLPARQQTLRGAIAWSYDLLSAEECKLFRRLSVFVNGFALEAAEAVCSGAGVQTVGAGGERAEAGSPEPLSIDLLDGIGSLSAKSLLRHVEEMNGSGAGEPRFMVLDTIREYGLEKLEESGETDAMRRNHAEYFLSVIEKEGWKLVSAEAYQTTQLLTRDLDNIRAALAWSLEKGEGDLAVRMAGPLGFYWDWAELFTEGRKWSEEVLTRFGTDETTLVQAHLLSAAGMMAFLQGDLLAARPRLERGLAIARELGDSAQVGLVLHGLGMTAWQQGDRSAARRYLSESVMLSRKSKYRWGLGMALFSLGDTLLAMGDDAAARSSYEESVSALGSLGDELGRTLPLNSLGRLAWYQGDYESARSIIEQALQARRAGNYSYYIGISLTSLAEVARCEGRYEESAAMSEEAIALFRKLGDLSGVAWCRYNMGYVAYYREDYSRAATLLRESLQWRIEQHNKEGIALGLAALACVAARTGRWEDAARLFSTADTRLEALDARLSPADARDYEQARALARGRFDETRWQELMLEGSTMSPETAVERNP